MSNTLPRHNPFSMALDGSLDFNTVPELRKNLLKALKKVSTPAVELDFTRVTKVDTSGIAMLIELNRIAVSKGGKLSLTGMNDQVKRMMRLARLDQVLPLEGLAGVGLEP